MITWPATLVSSVARRRVVILIGSGISANAQTADGRRPPTWGAFLEVANKRLARKLPHIQTALKRYNYLEACDYLKTEHGPIWNDIIREYFVEPAYKPSLIHKAIFDLDSRIVASLNFDKIYENYAVSSSESTVFVKNYYDDDVRQTVAGSDRYILKPHGSVDTMSKMIFTLDDYARARIAYQPFYELMTALLHTHTFLCVGCGLSDPDMKLIFEDYRYRFSETPHFMTLPNPIAPAEEVLIQKTRGITVLKYSSKENHRDLTLSLEDLGQRVAAKRDEIAKLLSW